MKRTISFILFLILLGTSLCINVSAEETDIKFTSYNLKLFASGIALYDSEYGNTTDTDERHYEITVENGCVTKIGGCNSNIPDNGFVISARGDKNWDKLKNVKVGDYCVVNQESNIVTFLGEDYDPFYSNTINFDKFNGIRTADTIVIYDKGETTETNIWGNEVSVDSNGFVISVGGNDSVIPVGGFVISAVGAERIKELNGAAALGLKVTVDKTKKTITFSNNKDSLCAAAEIKLNSAKELLSNAKSSFLLIDYDKAQENLKMLEQLYKTVCDASNENNIPKAVSIKSSFDALCSKFAYMVIEHPVVEGRAIWLRPDGLKSKDDVAKRVKEIKDMGYNIICLELLYDSVFICPMPEDGYFVQNPALNGFDLLSAFVTECKKQNIELHGWLSVFRVSYSTSKNYDKSLAAKKPEWLCVSKKGVDYVANEYGNGYFIDPANKEATEYLLSVYKYLLKNYMLDGIQLDYIRYPHQTNEHFGYTDIARSKFEELYSEDPINIKENTEEWNKWVDFRCDLVTDFVKEAVKIAKDVSPMTTVSCDVAPNLNESRKTHLQDAKKWLEEGIVEVVFPMAYGVNAVPMYAGITVDACGSNGLAYIGVGDYGAEVYLQQILESRASRAEGIAFFSYSQYTAGTYSKKIASTLFSKNALSPTYNAKEAVIAILETIVARLALMKDTLTDQEFNSNNDALLSLIDDLKNNSLSEYANSVFELCDNLEKLTDKNSADAFSSDIIKLRKIVKISKDDYRNFVSVQEDSSLEESNTSSAEIHSSKGKIVIVVAVILILVSASAVIVYAKKKK